MRRDRVRGYRWLLRLLPASLRVDYGGDMEALFAARLRDARGAGARLRVCVQAVRDVVSVALDERFGGGLRRSRGHGARSRAHRLVSGIGLDVRYAIRTLVRSPTYAIATVLTLGVGIGCVTALFSVVHGVLLRPLPYRDAERLVLVNSPLMTPDNVTQWVGELRVAEAWGVFGIGSRTAVFEDGAARVRVMPIGAGLLDAIGWRAAEGRAFVAADHVADAAPVALVSERFARAKFGDGPAAGQTLRLSDGVYEIVGVLPRDELLVYDDLDVWLPFENTAPRAASLLVRLPPNMSVESARARLQPLADRLITPDFRRRMAGMRITTLSMHGVEDIVFGDVRRTLWLLFAASGLVLLLSTLNVAHLAVGRVHGRASELALRTALGAGRGRLVRQLTVEALVIGAGGVLLGLLLARATPALLALAPAYLPRIEEVRMDGIVVAWAAAAAFGAVLVFGVAPGWWLARRSERASLRAVVERSRRTGAGQGMLVIVEVAVAFTLVVGVALMGRTYAALRPAEPGFRIEDRVAASFSLPTPAYAEDAAIRRFTETLLEDVQHRAGARAAVTTDLPLTGMTMFLQAARGQPGDEQTGVHLRAVSTGYLELMEMQLLAGRMLHDDDAQREVVSIVVNETAARELWGDGRNVLGRRTTLAVDDEPVHAEVVGVLRDAWALRGPEPAPEVFAPFLRLPYARFRVVVESTRSRPVDQRLIVAAVTAVDPNVPVLEFSTIRDAVAWTTLLPRFQAALLGILSTIALILAATGCFAVLSQMVGRRTRELGIRVALGAQSRSIARLVLGRIGVLAVCGLAGGAVAAHASARVLESELYGVTRSDPSTYIAAALVLTVTLLLAAARPLWRALRVDPLHSLRAE